MNCYFCKSTSSIQKKDYQYEKNVQCLQCGKYKIRQDVLDSLPDNNLHLLSAYVRKQTDLGTTPEITNDVVQRIINAPEMSFMEKMDNLLLAYVKDLENYNQDIKTSDKKYIAMASAKDEKEYQYLYSKALVSKGYLYAKDAQRFRFTPDGLIYVDSLRKQTNSLQGFVAMWFDSSMKPIWENAIAPAFNGTGFKAFRIDNKEHNDKIDDQIIAEIQRSRFLVADFTGHRGGVYFEAGYALGRGIPVIWTCKADAMKDLHFDIRQYNTIDWLDTNDLKSRLYQRIRATIG